MTEDRTKRAASYLLGITAGLCSAPMNVSAKWKRNGRPLFERLAVLGQCIAEIHDGRGWSNPLDIWEMESLAKELGFEKTGLQSMNAVRGAVHEPAIAATT